MTDTKLHRSAFASVGKTFRGEIWENCKRFRLIGSAYEAMPKEQNGHFCIESARHLEGPLRALRDPSVRTVIIIGATQVMKSVAGDIWVPYMMEHDPRNMLVLFEDDPKAKLYCDVRFMETVKKHPALSAALGEVDRSDSTKTFIKFPAATLLVGGLNDGNTSSLSWPLIWVSEAWQHGKDGLLKKAIKRADRFPDDAKILIESQASNWGEDLHTEASAAHQVPLTWACPFCGGRQSWDFSRQRPEDFMPLPVIRQPRYGESAGFFEPKPGTYSGMTFDREEKYLPKNGDWNIDAAAATAAWNCYHCGTDITDTKSNRQSIMDSYRQDYKYTVDGYLVSPRTVCFTLPKEAARNNRFEDSAKNYLTAKAAKMYSGNELPLRDWYLSDRATFWKPDMDRVLRLRAQEKYDAGKEWPEEWRRVLVIDCQHELQFFWGSAWSVSRTGKSRQLWRGPLKGFDGPGGVAEKQKELGIKDQWVFLDGRYMTRDVIDACAKHGHWGTIGGVRHYLCWNVLQGSALFDFRHEAEKDQKKRFPISDAKEELRQIGKFVVTVLKFQFSALQMGDMASRYRDGNGPETLFLPETESPDNPLSWTRQINSHVRVTEISQRTGLPTDIWKPPKDTAPPDHFWHILRMFMAVQCIWQIDTPEKDVKAESTVEV